MTHHAAEGAFEDWARRQLLGGDEHPDVGALFGEIHRAVRARREERNRVFAAGVSEWLTGAQGQGIVPIEYFLTRVVAPLGRLRPVLVLVLDGMDAGIFEELGESMYGRGWMRHRGAAPEAVLAVLPTVTESSRMALLTGGVKRGNSAAEKVGFARHPELRDASRAGRPPRLFHKGELTDGAAEGLAAPVREALGGERQRIVGIVLNAVDDHLAKSEQMQLTWRVDSVRLLPAILNEAHAAGRAVILASDHGHVLEADGVKLPGEGEGRWRSAAAPATELEIEVKGPRVRAATGMERIVLPWSESVRYGSKRNGYHGGVSLQEAVVPVGVYVGPGEVARRLGTGPGSVSIVVVGRIADAGAISSSGVGAEVGGSRNASGASTRPVCRGCAKGDRGSLTVGSALRVRGVCRATSARRLESAGRRYGQCGARCVSEAQGRLPLVSLATRLDVPAMRTRGIVAGLQRLLNVDGYPVLRFNDDTEHVNLDGHLFVKLFNLEP